MKYLGGNKMGKNTYCESTIICWHQFLWFLQNALINGFLNSWFQTLQARINGKIAFHWIFIFVVLVDHEISENSNPTINNDFTVFTINIDWKECKLLIWWVIC